MLKSSSALLAAAAAAAVKHSPIDLVNVSNSDVQITCNVTTQLNGTAVMSTDSQCQLYQTLHDAQVICITHNVNVNLYITQSYNL